MSSNTTIEKVFEEIEGKLVDILEDVGKRYPDAGVTHVMLFALADAIAMIAVSNGEDPYETIDTAKGRIQEKFDLLMEGDE